jgi:hypothetical protein
MRQTIPMPDNCDEGHRDLLRKVYRDMNDYLLKKGNWKINHSINNTVKTLKKRYHLSKNDILHHIYLEFISKEHYLKYDPGKFKRTTFTVNCTYYMLKNLLRKLERLKMKPHFSTVSLDEDYLENALVSWQPGFCPGLSNRITPEDEYIGMELQGIVDDYFDEFDGQVLSGYSDRHEMADQQNIKYNTYCKHLCRKIDDFMTVLSGTGYLC